MLITGIEGSIELGQKEAVIADGAPQGQQRIAQWGTIAFAMQVGMLRQQLAQQGGTGPGQASHADEIGCHCMHLKMDDTCASIIRASPAYGSNKNAASHNEAALAY